MECLAKIVKAVLKILGFCLLSCCLLSTWGLAAAPPVDPAEPIVSNYQYTLPTGTLLKVILQESLTTEGLHVGQTVEATISQDLYIGTTRILSRADRVYGRISDVQSPVIGRNAILRINFTTLALDSGAAVPINATLDVGKNKDFFGGELTEATRTKVVPYNIFGIGSYGRAMPDGPRAMGTQVALTAGTPLTVVLKQPVTILAGF